jgi:dsDNA-specific endonuclease/ATPase MutS2
VKGNRNKRSTPLRGVTKEVDLHLRVGYSGADALERQLSRFTGELDAAIRRGEGEIIFIHGYGNGRLREEIRSIVAARYPECVCADASFSRYGYGGATTVAIGKKGS